MIRWRSLRSRRAGRSAAQVDHRQHRAAQVDDPFDEGGALGTWVSSSGTRTISCTPRSARRTPPRPGGRPRTAPRRRCRRRRVRRRIDRRRRMFATLVSASWMADVEQLVGREDRDQPLAAVQPADAESQPDPLRGRGAGHRVDLRLGDAQHLLDAVHHDADRGGAQRDDDDPVLFGRLADGRPNMRRRLTSGSSRLRRVMTPSTWAGEWGTWMIRSGTCTISCTCSIGRAYSWPATSKLTSCSSSLSRPRRDRCRRGP